MRRRLTAAVAALTFALPAAAAEPEVRTLDAGQASPPAAIGAVAWLTGRWVGEGLGGESEEAYAAPRGGQMIGHFRQMRDGQPAFYEFVLLRERGGSLIYAVKHFNPDATAWEEKDRWTEFPLVAVEDRRVFFSGLTLERVGEDGMQAHLRLRRRDTGETWIETFRYRRAP